MDWNMMARTMQRAPFFAKGTEEAIEDALKTAAGISPFPKRTTHDYVPHPKHKTFCDVCGYGPSEPLMHTQR